LSGKKVLDIEGNYMGYIDIGGVRYMDLREVDRFYFPVTTPLLFNTMFVDISCGQLSAARV
jgi:hypothetical protein